MNSNRIPLRSGSTGDANGLVVGGNPAFIAGEDVVTEVLVTLSRIAQTCCEGASGNAKSMFMDIFGACQQELEDYVEQEMLAGREEPDVGQGRLYSVDHILSDPSPEEARGWEEGCRYTEVRMAREQVKLNTDAINDIQRTLQERRSAPAGLPAAALQLIHLVEAYMTGPLDRWAENRARAVLHCIEQVRTVLREMNAC